ncbi:MAG: hypothetical protein K940chlam6_01698, partial [Chlamydiae bacterium]|nr:hypothetical protein [Chlamydiota bacterium]
SFDDLKFKDSLFVVNFVRWARDYLGESKVAFKEEDRRILELFIVLLSKRNFEQMRDFALAHEFAHLYYKHGENFSTGIVKTLLIASSVFSMGYFSGIPLFVNGVITSFATILPHIRNCYRSISEETAADKKAAEFGSEITTGGATFFEEVRKQDIHLSKKENSFFPKILPFGHRSWSSLLVEPLISHRIQYLNALSKEMLRKTLLGKRQAI